VKEVFIDFASFNNLYLIGFSQKNIIRSKLRNRLRTETVDKLLRVALNYEFVNINKAVDHFTSKKQSTFNAYITSKIEYHTKKITTLGISTLFIYQL
jgi:hypothetical protein